MLRDLSTEARGNRSGTLILKPEILELLRDTMGSLIGISLFPKSTDFQFQLEIGPIQKVILNFQILILLLDHFELLFQTIDLHQQISEFLLIDLVEQRNFQFSNGLLQFNILLPEGLIFLLLRGFQLIIDAVAIFALDTSRFQSAFGLRQLVRLRGLGWRWVGRLLLVSEKV